MGCGDMRSSIILVIPLAFLVSSIESVSSVQASSHDGTYIMVGGKNRAWFQAWQTPDSTRFFWELTIQARQAKVGRSEIHNKRLRLK